MFTRTVTVLDKHATSKKVLVFRAQSYMADVNAGRLNAFNSPFYEIPNTAYKVGLLDTCMDMIVNEHFYSKESWRRIVWQTIWQHDDEDCLIMY